MKPTESEARSTLVDLLIGERDLAPALHMLNLWDSVTQVVPRPKAVATTHVNALLNNG